LTVATVIAAAGALWLAWLNRQLVQAGQSQVQQAMEARFDANRPILQPIKLDWNQSPEIGRLTVRNVGTGLALNVNAQLSMWTFAGEVPPSGTTQISASFNAPISAGENETAKLFQAAELPPETTIQSGTQSQPIVMTQGTKRDAWQVCITYHDIFGRKHASIFQAYQNRVSLEHEWRCVAIMPDIRRDLEEIASDIQPS
jgi:hypothetical protein